MPILRKCRICKENFYAKLFHVKKGQGLYCSRKCHYADKKGRIVKCFTCHIDIYKTLGQIKRPKSGKFFCNKSCQTKWRNKIFSGSRHKGWKGGFSLYRDLLLNNSTSPNCILCKNKDLRVLAVHHVDENRKNNNLKNLEWLCYNCHYLVHHFKKEKDKFGLLRVN